MNRKKLSFGKIFVFILITFIGISSFIIAQGDPEYETDCMGCHGGYDFGEFSRINASLFGVHININSTDGTGNITNYDCIECHYDISDMYTSGFTVDTYTCEDCHIDNITGIVMADRIVSNHIPNGSTNLSLTGASCGDCHNKTANLYRYSANASAAHYSINASFGISPGASYCAYCHANSSTIYRDVMEDQNNSNLGSHTTGKLNPGHPAGNPDCTTCHRSDRIHGTNLIKPVPDSAFCNNCHQLDTIQKDKHAGTVECIQCHAESNSSLHNIQYLLPNGTYRSVNATGCGDCHGGPWPAFKLGFQTADCTTCHLGNGLDNFADAPRLPSPIAHSSNPASGGLWNGSSPAYWDSQLKACQYCHGEDKLHDTDPLGNVANIQSGNARNQSITNTSFWCANCHYNGSVSSGNYSYNATAYTPLPPEIQNMSGLVPAQASDGTNFYNHTLDEYSDETCRICHTVSSPLTTAIFIHTVSSGGGGKDCVSCHDIGGGAPLDKQLDISAMNQTSALHYNLNSNSAGLTMNPANQRCWACHGDGNGAEAEQSAGHPADYKTPKDCSNGDCHVINQSVFNEPMIYSHFNNSERVNNPGNLVSNNISTRAACQECHDESLEDYQENSPSPVKAVVSHYGSTNDLVDLTDQACTYCHRDDDDNTYAQDWGNATDPMDNVSDLTDIRKMKTVTVAKGDSQSLGNGFYFTLDEVDLKGGFALLALYRDGMLLDRPIVDKGNEYLYSEWWYDDGDKFNQTLVSINTISVFRGGTNEMAQFEARGIKRLHKDNDAQACMICHTKTLNNSQDKYIILEKDEGRTYYAPLYADFNDEDSPVESINIAQGSQWNAGEYSLKVNELDIKGKKAHISLYLNEISVKDDVVQTDEVFEYYRDDITYSDYLLDNTTFFTAKVTGIFSSMETSFATFENIKATSMDILAVSHDGKDKKDSEYGNEWVGGYNVSWLRVNDTFTPGGKPDTIHSPRLTDGAVGGSDCVKCHDTSMGFEIPSIDAISSSLGVHGNLNQNTTNNTILTNVIDKACWACHGNGDEPTTHHEPHPKACNDCHRTGHYGAIDLSDVPHGIGTVCQSCHGPTHNVHPLAARATISDYEILDNDIVKGESLDLSVIASAGWGMNIEAVEYFIDNTGNGTLTGIGMTAQDGAFDSNVEYAHATIDTTDMEYGSHTIYVRAKERNRWGYIKEIPINVTEPNDFNTVLPEKNIPLYIKLTLFTLLPVAIFIIAYYLFRRYSSHVGL